MYNWLFDKSSVQIIIFFSLYIRASGSRSSFLLAASLYQKNSYRTPQLLRARIRKLRLLSLFKNLHQFWRIFGCWAPAHTHISVSSHFSYCNVVASESGNGSLLSSLPVSCHSLPTWKHPPSSSTRNCGGGTAPYIIRLDALIMATAEIISKHLTRKDQYYDEKEPYRNPILF